jgi:hypothetical protein
MSSNDATKFPVSPVGHAHLNESCRVGLLKSSRHPSNLLVAVQEALMRKMSSSSLLCNQQDWGNSVLRWTWSKLR